MVKRKIKFEKIPDDVEYSNSEKKEKEEEKNRLLYRQLNIMVKKCH